jgi:hypothetical protein
VRSRRGETAQEHGRRVVILEKRTKRNLSQNRACMAAQTMWVNLLGRRYCSDTACDTQYDPVFNGDVCGGWLGADYPIELGGIDLAFAFATGRHVGVAPFERRSAE